MSFDHSMRKVVCELLPGRRRRRWWRGERNRVGAVNGFNRWRTRDCHTMAPLKVHRSASTLGQVFGCRVKDSHVKEPASCKVKRNKNSWNQCRTLPDALHKNVKQSSGVHWLNMIYPRNLFLPLLCVRSAWVRYTGPPRMSHRQRVR